MMEYDEDVLGAMCMGISIIIVMIIFMKQNGKGWVRVWCIYLLCYIVDNCRNEGVGLIFHADLRIVGGLDQH